MTILYTLIALISVIALIVGFGMMPFRGYRERGKILSGLGVVALLGSLIAAISEMDGEARSRGFINNSDFVAAKEAGISNPNDWRQVKDTRARQVEEKRKSEEAEAAKRAEEARITTERETAEREEKCRQDITCLGEKHFVAASVKCRDFIERLAKNDFKWTDGFAEPKMSHYQWKNKKTGVITYIGDKIKFQNGFGAWIHHTYQCDFDTATDTVVNAHAKPGRLPPT